jgi:nitrite reductase/ring-hydroxylating ferredoxin subunit
VWWFRSRWHAVATVGDVKPGDVRSINVDGLELALGLDGDRYFAVQRQCVHRGGDLSQGKLARDHLICPRHGWQFSTETGRDSASAACLDVYPVRVVGTTIEVCTKKQRRS